MIYETSPWGAWGRASYLDNTGLYCTKQNTSKWSMLKVQQLLFHSSAYITLMAAWNNSHICFSNLFILNFKSRITHAIQPYWVFNYIQKHHFHIILDWTCLKFNRVWYSRCSKTGSTCKQRRLFTNSLKGRLLTMGILIYLYVVYFQKEVINSFILIYPWHLLDVALCLARKEK